MNVNTNGTTVNNKGRGRQIRAVPIQRTLMGPPKRYKPRSKASTSFNSSSHIQWRLRQNNFYNNSATAQTTSTSRSHSSTEPESRIVIALSEGRGEAVGEVGIAAINIAHPSLILCQISDSQSYINTLTKINILNPNEILIPLTFVESFCSNRLIDKVKEKFHGIQITGVPRSSFNKNTGLQYVKQLCVPSMNSILLVLQHRYYALAAAAALLHYTEATLFVVYAKESIKVEYQESEGSTIIDVATASGLELVASARPSIKKRFSCLLDVLNHCLTKIGTRVLRATILQPSCSVPDIEARLDCVTELVEHTDMLGCIQASLMKLVNIDQVLSLATILPDQAQSCSERQLNYILILNSALEQINPLRNAIEKSKQPFFVELHSTLSNPVYEEIKKLVRSLIHSDAWPAKGQCGIIQRCFAIKSGVNSLLDLLRKSYSERVDDMREYVKSLGEKYGLALTLNNTHKKGYHILLTLNTHQKHTLHKSDLPNVFIGVERLPNSYTMKTQDLINLSYRVEDMMFEILKMSNIMVFRLLIQIREHIGVFYKLCEDIAQLDLLQSLAKASSTIHYVRPRFSDYLEIEQGRHPLLDFLCNVEPTANSVFASKEYNMNIITGPNGSGKSIFIRQIALLQVMAQVGCYIPAHAATLRVSDCILAKLYLEDNMDCNASAFVLEMKEIQYFLNVLTDNSLIVIDELCRSTSVEEGTALAMAICEKLMKTSAFVFITTHFKLMATLKDMHYNVKCWQLETLTEVINNKMILQFSYNVIEGVTSLEHYGIFLAKSSWPETIIQFAEEILNKLSKVQKEAPPKTSNINKAARLKYDLEVDFKILKLKKKLTQNIIHNKLEKYQKSLQELGFENDQVNVNQENNNCDSKLDLIDIPTNVEMEDISQILNYHEDVTNKATPFEGFNFHSSPTMIINVDEDQNKQAFNDEPFDKSQIYSQDFTNRNFLLNCTITNDDVIDNNSFRNGVDLSNLENKSEHHLETEEVGNGNFNLTENVYGGFFEGPNDQDSQFNIFEPDIILQTPKTDFGYNFFNGKKSQEVSFGTNNMNRNDTCSSCHTTYQIPDISTSHQAENNLISSQHSFASVIKETSIVSQNNSFYIEIAANDKVHETYNSVISEQKNISSRQYQDTESVLSINDQLFSLPLQYNQEKTSTPLHVYSEPLLDNYNPINTHRRTYENNLTSTNTNTIEWGMPAKAKFSINKTSNSSTWPTYTNKLQQHKHELENQYKENNNKEIFLLPELDSKPHSDSSSSAIQKKLITNSLEQKLKSTSSNSNSIKWKAEKLDNTHTSMSTVEPVHSISSVSNNNNASIANMNKETSLDSKITIYKSQDLARHKKESSNSDNTNFKMGITNNSIAWKAEIETAAVPNYNESLYDIADLQSCSEYFTDDDHWDTIDEEISLKLKQINSSTIGTPQENKFHPIISQSVSEPTTRTENNEIQSNSQQQNIKNNIVILQNILLINSNQNIQTDLKSENYHALSSVQNINPSNLNDNNDLERMLNYKAQKIDVYAKNNVQVSSLEINRPENKIDEDNYGTVKDDYNINHTNQIKEVNNLEIDYHKSQTSNNFTVFGNTSKIESTDNINQDCTENGNKQNDIVSQITKILDDISSDKYISQNNKSLIKPNSEIDQDHEVVQKGTDPNFKDQKEIESQAIKSLEPLGNIHLELFSDETLAEDMSNYDGRKNERSENDANESIKSVDIRNSDTKNCNVDSEAVDDGIIDTSQDNNIYETSLKLIRQKLNKYKQQNKLKSSQNNDDRVVSTSNKENLGCIDASKSLAALNIENKSDVISQPQPSSLFQVSPKSSDFEISDEECPKKKNIFLKKSKQNKLKNRPTPFKPPAKLTKKEIELDFYRQDKMMLESENSAQYIQQLLKRPSVKQVQATKHIMSIHKTNTGVIVIPADNPIPKNKKRKFVTPLKCPLPEIDPTFLSDRNSIKYEELLNLKKNQEQVVNVRQDIQYIKSETVRKQDVVPTVSTDSSQASCFENVANSIKRFKTEGYYTQNKEHIDEITNKYLTEETTSNKNSLNTRISQISNSIFDEPTIIINDTSSLEK